MPGSLIFLNAISDAGDLLKICCIVSLHYSISLTLRRVIRSYSVYVINAFDVVEALRRANRALCMLFRL